MTPSKSRPASPKLTLGPEEVFDHATRIAPPAPHRLISSLPANLPMNLPEHAIDEDEEEEGSFGANTITRHNKNGDKETSGKAGLDRDSNPRRRPGPIKSSSAIQIPTEKVFGSSSRPSGIKTTHKICRRMLKREFNSGFGPNVSWERKEKQGNACACEGFARRQTESPRTGDDGRRSKDVFSDDDEREIWSQIDALDYHARGW